MSKIRVGRLDVVSGPDGVEFTIRAGVLSLRWVIERSQMMSLFGAIVNGARDWVVKVEFSGGPVTLKGGILDADGAGIGVVEVHRGD